MKLLLLLPILALAFIPPVWSEPCEVDSNDDGDLKQIESTYLKRRTCDLSTDTDFSRTKFFIQGRVLDFSSRCQESIDRINIEIIRVNSQDRTYCSEEHNSYLDGHFNLTTVTETSEEILYLKITSMGYKTYYKKMMVSSSNYTIILLKHAKSKNLHNLERMKSIVDQLLSEMTLDEKIGQLNLVSVGFNDSGPIISDDLRKKIIRGDVGTILNTYTPAAVRELQELVVNSTRLKIPFIFGFDVIHGHRTIFPIPLGLSATWNMTLIERSARIAAQEATSDALNWVFSPMIDIARDPRWGRIMEGSGEDPWLGSQIAAAMVHGYQGNNLSSIDTVMACFKHFGLYGAAEAGRDYNTVDMSILRMLEFYLPPYRAAVDAGAGSVMTSFNEINGLPSTANHWLLTDLLRDQWNFTGFVVTDFTAISELIAHGLGNLQDVSARSINAGVDIDMASEGFLTTLNQSVQQGKVDVQTIEQACRRVLEAKYLLGLLDDPFHYINESRPHSNILTEDNRLTARDFARRSFVLLKNDKNILPLRRFNLTIALVGPLADDRRNLLGSWSAAGDWNQSVSVFEGINQLVGNNIQIMHAKGSNLLEDDYMLKILNAYDGQIVLDNRTATQMIDEAVAVAQKSDVIVAVVGETQGMTGEAASRADISLPVCQQRLLQALFNIGKPVVIVLMNGRPLTLAWEDQYAAAILETWFAGTEAGNAIADVLFGYYNPAGKLTATFPRSVGQIPVYYNHKNTGRPYNSSDFLDRYKSRYLDIPNDPLYPFGYGLSYTSFNFGPLKYDKTELHGESDYFLVHLNVTNKGFFDGEEVIQLYIGDPVASVTRAVRELKGYQKIFIPANGQQEITFTVTTEYLKFFDSNLNYIWEEGVFNVYIGPDSVNTQTVQITWFK